MRRIVRKIVEYQCEVCRRRHPRESDAQKCEKSPVEVKKFKKGDVVRGIEAHICNHGRKDIGFRPRGTVVQITGPEIMDEDYSHRWLGGKLLGQHVFLYEVSYKCFCGKQRGHLYYSSEIEKVISR